MLGKFTIGNCTGSRVLTPVNSTEEQQQDKLTAQIKEAPVAESAVQPSTPTPDHTVAAEAPAPAVAQVPAVPAGDAVKPAEKPLESGVSAS